MKVIKCVKEQLDRGHEKMGNWIVKLSHAPPMHSYAVWSIYSYVVCLAGLFL
jgi:hypothetical protein